MIELILKGLQIKISRLADKAWLGIVFVTLKTQSKKYLVLLLIFLLTLAVISINANLSCLGWFKAKPLLYQEKRVSMGTFVEVISPEKAATKIVFAEIQRIDNLLSKYNQNSEIARLNKEGRLAVSRDTAYLLRKAKEFWLKSGGALDITVGPLLELWGFTDKDYRVPEKKEIKKALELVGMEKIVFVESDNVVEFSLPGMQIDLGAIAKGYAIDCAVKKLKENNIKSCLINAGGNIYCLGNKFGKPWEIAIQDPREEGDFLDYLRLEDQAVATSGDYEQYFTKKNTRYAHIFNPRTGSPVNSGIISVTVIAPDALTADALSTSIFVLGKRQGMELAGQFADVKVKIVEEKDLELP
jgi:thiamine biosynthesis lipoprotein